MPAPIVVKEGQCEGCRIFIDGKEEHYIEEYREHKICFYCQALWRRREEMAGHDITWQGFVSGQLGRGFNAKR